MLHSFLSVFLACLLASLFTCAKGGAGGQNVTTFCDQYDAVDTTSLRYTILSNQWADDGSGKQCITANLGNRDDGYTSFNTTWQWFQNKEEVHSFPSVVLNSRVIPMPVSNLTSLAMNASWSFITAPDQTETDVQKLANSNTSADVVLDLFFDLDPTTSSNASHAAIEVMVWGATYGNVWPLGFDTLPASPPTYELADVNYPAFVLPPFPGATSIESVPRLKQRSILYKGNNTMGQNVFSWVPKQNLSSINTDIYPLVQSLINQSLVDPNMYLGRVQFGSETMHTAKDRNVTFVVDHIELNVNNEKWNSSDSSGSSGGDGGANSTGGSGGDSSGGSSAGDDGSGGSGSNSGSKGAAESIQSSPLMVIAFCMAFVAWQAIGR